jgi:hypothetical protein
MRWFLSSIIIQNRQREYEEQFLVKAVDCLDARGQTKRWVAEMYCGDRERLWSDKDQLELFDQTIAFEGTLEIPTEDYLVLQKYLPIVG